MTDTVFYDTICAPNFTSLKESTLNLDDGADAFFDCPSTAPEPAAPPTPRRTGRLKAEEEAMEVVTTQNENKRPIIKKIPPWKKKALLTVPRSPALATKRRLLERKTMKKSIAAQTPANKKTGPTATKKRETQNDGEPPKQTIKVPKVIRASCPPSRPSTSYKRSISSDPAQRKKKNEENSPRPRAKKPERTMLKVVDGNLISVPVDFMTNIPRVSRRNRHWSNYSSDSD